MLYDSSQTDGSAFLLVTAPDTCINPGVEWISSKSELFPLTIEKIMGEINDTTKSVEWRCHFIAMLWDQPRPVKNAGTILKQIFTDRNNPDVLKFSAAFSLIETGNKPMLDSLKQFVLDEEYNVNRRAVLLTQLYKLEENDFSFYKNIAGNKSISPTLRNAAALALKNTKDSIYVTPELDEEIERFLEAEEYLINGNRYYLENKYAKSIVEYDKALYIMPDYHEALNCRGASYFKLMQFDKAINDFTKDIQLEPTNSSLNLRGMCYYKLKQYDKVVV